jgi:regulator of RNase E activity RraA
LRRSGEGAVVAARRHVKVGPGDFVYRDGDGVVVVPQELHEQVVAAARIRAAADEELYASLAAGEA